MSWAVQEFECLELGDERRTQRLIKLVDDLSAQPTGSIPLACWGWARTKAAYQLLDHPAVEWQEILEVHTARRWSGWPVRRGCCAFRTRPKRISPPKRGSPGWGR